MKTFLPFLLLAFLAACSPEQAVLGTAEAGAHLGREAWVRGVVTTCHACQGNLEGSWKLSLDGPPGSEPFAAILRPEVVQALGQEKLRSLEGKTIEVHGTITQFKGRPEIQLGCPSCLRVLN